MNRDDLALFLDVARLGSFAAVARQREMDPSSVSRAIAGLEAAIGVRLFQRSTRTLTLTEAGEQYLFRAAPLLEELDRIAAEARQMQARAAGTLRLSAAVSFGQFCIVPLLGAFRDRHPEVRLECLFTDANVDLVAERVDLAIRLGPTVEGDLVVAKLMDTAYRVVAAPGYLAGAPALAVPADLAAHRVLMLPLAAFRSRWQFRDAAGMVTEQPIGGDIVLSPATALRDAVLSGLGPALLPDWLVDGDIRAGRLTHCLPDWRVTPTTFATAAWFVYPSRAFLPLKVRVMIDFLRQSLAAPMPGLPIVPSGNSSGPGSAFRPD